MSESCPKCGANRTQFDGQTSWECGSYQSLLGGSHIKRPAFKLIESEHCLCRTALAAATKRAEEAERKLAEANEPFRDADPRIEIFQRDGYYGCKWDGGETAPFKTWREAYRFGEGFVDLRDINKRLTAEVERLKEAANIALGHVVELRDAWMRGVIRESDGNGGLRSNRNADVEYFLRCAIDGKDRQKINVVYSPAWLLSEDRPDA